jgi:nitroimidazol reductase NimA-like FMN-containing flavoprotein (pyridoxamine 5'-phosphate oxidase superfamily)
MMTRPPTRVRRLPEKQVSDLAALYEVLDAALVAHVAVATPDRLAVIPVGMARDRDRVLIHGSTASQAFRALALGAPTCLTVTLLDGVLVARSQFESSMHYRCAMVFGSFEVAAGAEKERALGVLTAALLPGLEGARGPSAKELAATMVLSLPIEDWSLKVSAGAPDDDDGDLDRPVWAGVVPLEHRWGVPVTAPDLRADLTPPTALADWPARG